MRYELIVMNLPQGSFRCNKALLGAFKKGVLAHQAGQPIEACPYSDKRKPDGRLSWSRAFRTMWQDGWRWSDKCKAGDVESAGPAGPH
jgi:hypothetical protein